MLISVSIRTLVSLIGASKLNAKAIRVSTDATAFIAANLALGTSVGAALLSFGPSHLLAPRENRTKGALSKFALSGFTGFICTTLAVRARVAAFDDRTWGIVSLEITAAAEFLSTGDAHKNKHERCDDGDNLHGGYVFKIEMWV